MHPNLYRKEQPTVSYIRVFHASPNSPAVDVYANDDLILENLSYEDISAYIPVPAANYNLKVYPTGQTKKPVIDTDVYIPANTALNVAAIGTLPNLSLYPILEPSIAQDSGNACVRFVHLAPNAPAVDIKLDNGTMVFDNIAYKGITNYMCIPAGTYTFTVSPAGSEDVVLTIPDLMLDANIYYTIYAIGLLGENPSLQAILISEPREE